MNTLHPTRAHVIIHVDHRDLAMAYAQHTLTAPDYARAVVCRARTPNGFLDAMAAPTILRCIPSLPEEVVAALDGEPLADLVATLLGLTPTTQDDPDRIILRRMTFTAQDFFPDLDLDEVRVVEPHRDPAHLGRRYVGWCADAAAPDTPTGGVGYGATPMAVLAALVDDIHQYEISDEGPHLGIDMDTFARRIEQYHREK